MNVSNDFTLNFAPFTGAGVNDSVFISIFAEEGAGEFQAPDPCRNIELPVTAASVLIPANTFQAGKSYSGSISFSRSSFDTNSIPGTSISGSTMVTTEFAFTTSGGGVPSAPRWTSGRRNSNGTLTFTLSADLSARVVIDGSSALPGLWTPVLTNVMAAATYEFTVTPNQANLTYRAKVQ